jgi:hypothetical protein
LHASGRRSGQRAGDRREFDTIVGLSASRIHAERAIFAVRAIDFAGPGPRDQLTAGRETFVVQGEPERRDPDRLV